MDLYVVLSIIWWIVMILWCVSYVKLRMNHYDVKAKWLMINVASAVAAIVVLMMMAFIVLLGW